jgi:Flp pilus assembly CpaE family ATPase
MYLKQLDLGDRVCVLVNRCQKRPMITPQQIEQLLGLPVHMTLPNDYHGVQRALTLGRWVDPATELGKQFHLLAQSIVEGPRPQSLPDQKKRFIEYFSLVPKSSSLTSKTAS